MLEIELKLALPPSQARRALRTLKAMPGATPKGAKDLHAVYYDTRARRLHDAGLVLRVRKSAGRFVQTVKGEASGLARQEWEDTIPGAQPDLDARRSGRILRKHLGKKARLRAQCVVDVRREVVEFRTPASRVEVALDRGEIRAGRRTAPVCEVEFELKSGTEADLYRIAASLARDVDLIPEPRPKSERGFALADRRRPKPMRAQAMPLDGQWTLGRALGEIGRGYLHQFERNIPAGLEQDDEGIHQMRVALRRLRAVLSAADKLFAPAGAQRVDASLKTVMQGLGGIRDWDVMAAKLAAAPRAGRTGGGYQRAAALVAKRRLAAHVKACAAVRSREYNKSLLEAARWFIASAGDRALVLPFDKAARLMLARQYKRVRKRGRNFKDLDDAGRHRLRIACKALRYTVEVCGQLYPRKRVRAFLKRLVSIQDALGHLNDVKMAHDLLGPLARGQGGGVKEAIAKTLARLDGDVPRLTAKAGKDVAALLATPRFW